MMIKVERKREGSRWFGFWSRTMVSCWPAAYLWTALLFSMAPMACKGPVDASQTGIGGNNDDPTGPDDPNSDDDPGPDVPSIGRASASLVRAERVLDSMVSCLGVESAGQAARDAWVAARTTFSEDGKVHTVNAPMLGAFVNVGSEVCSDLIDLESNVPASQRRIFSTIDFGQAVSNVTESQRTDVMHALARSCWGREASTEELQIVEEELTGLFANADSDITHTSEQMLVLCTAVLSTLSFYSM